MIYIFVALPFELEPIVDRFGLVYQDGVYMNENIIASTTGVGKVNAAFTMGQVFGKYIPDENSILINIGVAAGKNVGESYIINSILDQDTDKLFYPDMLYNLGLEEAALTTVSQVVNSVSDTLYDMESSAIYSCGIKFISPDRMFFIKVVSDSGVSSDEKITPKLISALIEYNLDAVNTIIENHNPAVIRKYPVDEYASKLYCSEYMRNELLSLMKFSDSMGIDYVQELNSIMSQYDAINSRKTGREVLDEFKKRLTE